MPANLIEISARFDHERLRFRNSSGDVIIGDAVLVNGSATDDPYITIKGPAETDELQSGMTYRFYGRNSTYTNNRTGRKEDQFHFQTFVELQPHNEDGIIAYLCRAGVGNNIGKATAKKIYDRFGADAIQTLRESPETVAESISRLSLDQCKAAAEWLQERVNLENTTIELTGLLAKRGFPKGTAKQAIKEWGNLASQVIGKNPYMLMGFTGCGFKRCDALYLDLGLRPGRLLRQALCAWYVVASDSSGHTWFPINHVVNGLNRNISGAEVRPVAALKMAKRIGRLSLDAKGALSYTREEAGAIVDEGGLVWAAEGRKANNEERLAKFIARAELEDGNLWPDVEKTPNIDDHQRQALENATIEGPIAILGGGPGTGKTFTAANLIKTMAEIVGYDNIAVGAPTGKAAVRISEVMDEYGVPLKARTIHSLLGFMEGGFNHNQGNPWDFKVIILDEVSMNDTDLMTAVFAARPKGCHVLLIGDINQLPPVGHGAPLRDMIAGRLPHGELTEIKRNSGGIVEACAAMREGKPWGEGDNLELIPAQKPEKQIHAMLLTLGAALGNKLNPVWDCQVLVAVNEKSPLSRKTVNEILQRELNPNGKSHKTNNKFRVGDKVVNLQNGSFSIVEAYEHHDMADHGDVEINDKGEAYVANGELAKVLEVHKKFCIVEVVSPKRVVRVPAGASWDLGYALSVHKSQGSEWPVVVVMIDEYPGAKMVCDRSWIYTAISRAKQKCVLIGKKSVADSMCKQNKINGRKTFLRERIEQQRAEKGVAGL